MIRDFFHFVQERYYIFYNKEIIKKLPPYTNDIILQKYHFCNITRQWDTGTKVVKSLECLNDLELLLNIVCYRIFNRNDHFDRIGWIKINEFNRDIFKEKIILLKEESPIFNSAYLVNWNFNNIIDGLEYIIDSKFTLNDCNSPKDVYNKLQTIKNIGPFIAYQLYLDLSYFGDRFHKWTSDDFVVIGPGSKWTVLYLKNLPDNYKISNKDCENYIYYLRDIQNEYLDIPYYLDLSDIEHSLCEWRKYLNFSQNKGKKRYWNFDILPPLNPTGYSGGF